MASPPRLCQPHAVCRGAAARRLCVDGSHVFVPDADGRDYRLGRRTSSCDMRRTSPCAGWRAAGVERSASCGRVAIRNCVRVLRQHRTISLSKRFERVAYVCGVAKKGVTHARQSAFEEHELSRLRPAQSASTRPVSSCAGRGGVSSDNGVEATAPRRPAAGAGRLIARYRRRRPTLAPGAASIRAPIYARGGGQPSVRAPIYSGRAANASSRRSKHSRAAAAAVAGDHAAVQAARSAGDPNKAACRGPAAVREGGIRAVRIEPRRCAANRRWRRGRRPVRWRATASVDAWQVLYLMCNRGCLTLACWSRCRVTRAVKAVTACHDDPPVGSRGAHTAPAMQSLPGQKGRYGRPPHLFTARSQRFRSAGPIFEIDLSKNYRFCAAPSIPLVVSMQPSRR